MRVYLGLVAVLALASVAQAAPFDAKEVAFGMRLGVGRNEGAITATQFDFHGLAGDEKAIHRQRLNNRVQGMDQAGRRNNGCRGHCRRDVQMAEAGQYDKKARRS